MEIKTMYRIFNVLDESQMYWVYLVGILTQIKKWSYRVSYGFVKLKKWATRAR